MDSNFIENYRKLHHFPAVYKAAGADRSLQEEKETGNAAAGSFAGDNDIFSIESADTALLHESLLSSCSFNILPSNHSKGIQTKDETLSYSYKNCEDDRAVAMTVHLPRGVTANNVAVTVELQPEKEKTLKSDSIPEDKIILKCSEETKSKTVFSGSVKVPTGTDMFKIVNMPLHLVDSREVFVLNPDASVTPTNNKNQTLEDNIKIKLRLDRTKDEPRSKNLSAETINAILHYLNRNQLSDAAVEPILLKIIEEAVEICEQSSIQSEVRGALEESFYNRFLNQYLTDLIDRSHRSIQVEQLDNETARSLFCSAIAEWLAKEVDSIQATDTKRLKKSRKVDLKELKNKIEEKVVKLLKNGVKKERYDIFNVMEESFDDHSNYPFILSEEPDTKRQKLQIHCRGQHPQFCHVEREYVNWLNAAWDFAPAKATQNSSTQYSVENFMLNKAINVQCSLASTTFKNSATKLYDFSKPPQTSRNFTSYLGSTPVEESYSTKSSETIIPMSSPSIYTNSTYMLSSIASEQWDDDGFLKNPTNTPRSDTQLDLKKDDTLDLLEKVREELIEYLNSCVRTKNNTNIGKEYNIIRNPEARILKVNLYNPFNYKNNPGRPRKFNGSNIERHISWYFKANNHNFRRKRINAPLHSTKHRTVYQIFPLIINSTSYVKPLKILAKEKLEEQIRIDGKESSVTIDILQSEFDLIQDAYENITALVQLIFHNTLNHAPRSPEIKESRLWSVTTIEADIASTFEGLAECLSVLDKILNECERIPLPEPPTQKDTSAENQQKTPAVEKEQTYITMEDEIKRTIEFLLKESECIKEAVILNGGKEEAEPPFECIENGDNPSIICAEILDEIIRASIEQADAKVQIDKPDEEVQRVLDAMLDAVEHNIGPGPSRPATTQEIGRKAQSESSGDRHKDSVNTYFCITTALSPKIPKTSFTFGGTPNSCLDISNLAKKSSAIKRKCRKKTRLLDEILSLQSDLERARYFNNKSEKFENFLQVSATISHFLGSCAREDIKSMALPEAIPCKSPCAPILMIEYKKSAGTSLLKNKIHNGNSAKDQSPNPKNENKPDTTIKKSQKFFQEGRSVNDSKILKEKGPAVLEEKEEKCLGQIQKSAKHFQLRGAFNRTACNNLPQNVTATAYTTEEEMVLKNLNPARTSTDLSSSEVEGTPAVEELKNIKEAAKFTNLARRNNSATSTSDDEINLNIRRYPPKRKKENHVGDVQITRPIAGNELDPITESLTPHSNATLKSKPGFLNVHEDTSLAPRSYNASEISLGTGRFEASDSDYEADLELLQIQIPKPKLTYKSIQELNAPEEIAKIEENVKQNEELEKRSKYIIVFSDSSLVSKQSLQSSLSESVLSEENGKIPGLDK